MIFDNAVFIKPDVEFVREFTGRNYASMFRKKVYLESIEDGLNDSGIPDWACTEKNPEVGAPFVNAVLTYKFYGIAYLAANLAGLC